MKRLKPRRTIACLLVGSAGFAGLLANVLAQDAPAPQPAEATGPNPQEELRAKRMVENAIDLIESSEEERGVNMLNAVEQMFPQSQAKYRAYLELGRHYMMKKKSDEALKALSKVRGSEDPDQLAEALYRTGAIYFDRADYNAAFVALRRVTNDYPSITFANDAYYYIGQGHFKQGRWTKAAEAFRMVGTAIPDTKEGEMVLAEAGQRLFAKVEDKDLKILGILGQITYVDIHAASGDKERVALEKLGRTDKDYIASVEMVTDASELNDGKLTVQGGEEITVTYVDQNNSAGEIDKPLKATVKVVSSGAVSFTDGAFRQSVKGAFAGQPKFIRLKDIDLDSSDQADTVDVRVSARYKIKPKEGEELLVLEETVDVDDLDAADRAKEERWETRGNLVVTLTETGPRTGIFHGKFMPVQVGLEAGSTSEISVQSDDELVLEYVDELHLGGTDPRTLNTVATVVVGGKPEPESITASSSDPNIQARKLLMEARLLHQWGGIFKEVGLDDTAAAKAEEGLGRADEIMRLTAKNSLERDLLEQAFAVKWDLFLIQGKLNEAIATCQALVKLFPDTELADRAFMKIGQARRESDKPEELVEAIRVFRSVLALPESTFKAEAQFRIGEATERLATLQATSGRKPNYAPAMLEFKKCAESYPDSAFAGESFKKIITFYIKHKDYSRAVELLDRVFQDYPDAPWLDEMLLKWGVVAYRMKNPTLATQKFQQVLEEFPNGSAAAQANRFLDQLSGR